MEATVSWDLFLMRLPADVSSVSELPNNLQLEPIGDLRTVLTRLREDFPNAQLCNPDSDDTQQFDPTSGHLSGDGWSMEIGLGGDDLIESVALHVRGGRDEVLPVITQLAATLRCRIIDTSTGDFLAG